MKTSPQLLKKAGVGLLAVLVLGAGLLLAACNSAPQQQGKAAPDAPQAASGTFTILHTKNIHNRPFALAPGNATAQTSDPGRPPSSFEHTSSVGGLAHLATTVARVRQAPGAAKVLLLLDGGDAFGGDLLANQTKGVANSCLLNALGYQFMTLGNHDYDYGSARTRELQQLAHFPMRGANATDQVTGQPFLGDPIQVFTVGGVRVGILALAYHNTGLTGNPKNTAALTCSSGLEAIRRYLPVLRARAGVVAVLSHQGTKVDERLAREVPGIDLIMETHLHDRIRLPRQVAGVWVVQARSPRRGAGARSLGAGDRRPARDHRSG